MGKTGRNMNSRQFTGHNVLNVDFSFCNLKVKEIFFVIDFDHFDDKIE